MEQTAQIFIENYYEKISSLGKSSGYCDILNVLHMAKKVFAALPFCSKCMNIFGYYLWESNI